LAKKNTNRNEDAILSAESCTKTDLLELFIICPYFLYLRIGFIAIDRLAQPSIEKNKNSISHSLHAAPINRKEIIDPQGSNQMTMGYSAAFRHVVTDPA